MNKEEFEYLWKYGNLTFNKSHSFAYAMYTYLSILKLL